MAGFEDRKKGQEAKFARDAELQFKAVARRNRLLGLWAAEQFGLVEDQANDYAAEVIAADFEKPGDEDVIGKVVGDFKAKGLAMSEDDVRAKLAEFEAQAREQLLAEG